MAVPADNYLGEPHVRIDHPYLAIVNSPVPVSEPVYPFSWYHVDELDAVPMFPDTLLLTKALFPLIGAVVTTTERDNASILHVLAAAGLS